ncbi:MAG: thiamine transport system ATP-binding protein [Paracoccaceae bacterium]|jgi:thiamine transport system ATP-binding protein
MLTLSSIVYDVNKFTLSANFHLPKRSRVAIIGPSGAGKSTLLSIISGFTKPCSGRVMLDNEDITRVSPGQRKVTSLFQDGNLFPHLTVEQNIALGIRPDLKLNTSQTLLLEAAIKRVGLSDVSKRKPNTLSGGQQSRISLARALVRDCVLLLLDEPFSALGPALKSEMLELVKEISIEKDLVLMFVTHDPEDAKQICDLSIVVAEGNVYPPNSTTQLFLNPPEVLKNYL